MDERLRRETQGLERSWARHSREMLRDYLVQGVEDPRINVQSILTRHFLIRRLLPGRFEGLMEQELRFSVVVNGLLRQPDGVGNPSPSLPAEADGVTVPDYVSQALQGAGAAGIEVGEDLLGTFQRLWSAVLRDERPSGVSVLEPACGSANDYRFLAAFGIARLIGYAGFDLCEKCIVNAREMFPAARFQVGNVFEIDAPDAAFDLCFVHDLFEHLSVEGMERAVGEVCRVTRGDLCIGFFRMHEGGRHVVCPVADYHRNGLSVEQTKAVFERHGKSVEAIHIDAFLKARFGYGDTHNAGAYTFVVSGDEPRWQGRR